MDEMESLRAELDHYKAEKEKIRDIVGQIGGKTGRRRQMAINVVFLSLVVGAFAFDVVQSVAGWQAALPPPPAPAGSRRTPGLPQDHLDDPHPEQGRALSVLDSPLDRVPDEHTLAPDSRAFKGCWRDRRRITGAEPGRRTGAVRETVSSWGKTSPDATTPRSVPVNTRKTARREVNPTAPYLHRSIRRTYSSGPAVGAYRYTG
jgi:hypothetical protein